MTQTSIGFDGTVDTIQWAKLARFLGREYCVDTTAALSGSQVPATRTVAIAPGAAFGRGVVTTLDASENVPLPTPAAGQWYLIVLRRVWASKATSLVAIPHTTTTTSVPTSYPLTYPAAMLASPGIQDDQPVLWAWVNQANTTMSLVDLRTKASATEAVTISVASKGALDLIKHLPIGSWALVGAFQYNWNGTTWATIVSDWVAWTTPPTGLVVGTGGSALLSQKYRDSGGGIVEIDCRYVLGTSGASVGVAPIINMPFAMDLPSPRYARIEGKANLYDVSATLNKEGRVGHYDTVDDKIYLNYYDSGALSNITATVPFAWAAGDSIRVSARVKRAA